MVTDSAQVHVAYFVQTHRDPEGTARLLRVLRRGSPRATLLVGSDPSGEPMPDELLAAHGALALRWSRPARRGDWSLVLPWVEAVEELRRRAVDYDWLVHLSGQCYPVQPVARSEAELAAAAEDGFVTFRDIRQPSPEGRRRQGVLRYEFRYREVPQLAPLLRLLRSLNSAQPLWHVHLTYGPRLGVRARRPPRREGIAVHVGSQWTTLRREPAERAAAAARDPQWLRRFACSICPDEAFVQTVLLAAGCFRLRNDNRRWVDHAGSRDGRPRVLRLADAPVLAASGCHFARKFDRTVDAAVLDWLDANAL